MRKGIDNRKTGEASAHDDPRARVKALHDSHTISILKLELKKEKAKNTGLEAGNAALKADLASTTQKLYEANAKNKRLEEELKIEDGLYTSEIAKDTKELEHMERQILNKEEELIRARRTLEAAYSSIRQTNSDLKSAQEELRSTQREAQNLRELNKRLAAQVRQLQYAAPQIGPERLMAHAFADGFAAAKRSKIPPIGHDKPEERRRTRRPSRIPVAVHHKSTREISAQTEGQLAPLRARDAVELDRPVVLSSPDFSEYSSGTTPSPLAGSAYASPPGRSTSLRRTSFV